MATRLLGGYQPGQKLWDAIAAVDAKAAAWMKVGWDSIRDGFLPVELLFEQLPNKLVTDDRVYRIEYKPSFVGEAVADTLIVITDATADIARARAEAAEHELLRTMEKLTKDRPGFLEFVAETDRLVREIAASAKQPITVELKRALHTLKGNCGLFGLVSLAEVCNELETRLADETVLDSADAHQITSVWRARKLKLESVFGPELMTSGVEVRAEDIAELQEALARGAPLGTIRQLVKSWSLERIKPRLERFADQARELAKRLGKGDVEVVVADHGVRLESSEGRRFWAAFTHVVRNAVDHGLETESERLSSGKPACGRIEIVTRNDGSAVVVELRDDGRGIDWESVRRKALDAGLPAGNHAQLVDAILTDGLTTRDVVTETSGRGVGLAALQAACTDAGGVIDVSSEPGRGARFTFRFPRWAEDVHLARSIA
jgi:chemotaxis protein histidine kinase CheA